MKKVITTVAVCGALIALTPTLLWAQAPGTGTAQGDLEREAEGAWSAFQASGEGAERQRLKERAERAIRACLDLLERQLDQNNAFPAQDRDVELIRRLNVQITTWRGRVEEVSDTRWAVDVLSGRYDHDCDNLPAAQRFKTWLESGGPLHSSVPQSIRVRFVRSVEIVPVGNAYCVIFSCWRATVRVYSTQHQAERTAAILRGLGFNTRVFSTSRLHRPGIQFN
jgi:hypothetical protein